MQGRVSVGHPVDVASGVFYTASHDVVLAGAIPLVWRRVYSVGLLGRKDPSILGPGWVHFFDIWLRRTSYGFLLFGHDGSQVRFEDPDHRADAGAVILNAGAHMDLRREGDRYAVYHWHGWDGDIQKLMFPATPGPQKLRLDAVENPQGNALQLEYENNRLLRVTQSAEGRGIVLNYSGSGVVRQITATAPGTEPVVMADYEYTDSGLLIISRDPAGNVQRYAYDDRNRMVQESGHGGVTFFMRYDAAGRCVEVSGTNQYQQRLLDYDVENKVTRVRNSLGAMTSYGFNDLGQVMLVRHPDGGITRRSYDSANRIREQIDPLGRVTTYEHDERGNRTARILYGNRTEWTFDDLHQVTGIRNPDGSRWTFERERNRIVSITDQNGQIIQHRYDERGDRVEEILPGDFHIRIQREGNVETVRDDIGLVDRTVFDPWGREIREEDARGLVTEYEWNILDLCTGMREGGGTATKYVSNPAGELLEIIHSGGRKVSIEYDEHGDATRLIEPHGAVYTFEYNSEGRTTAIVNPLGERASFEYDAMGRLRKQTGFNGRIVQQEFDLGGRMIREIKPDGQALDYLYDDWDNLLEIRAGAKTLQRWRYAFGSRMIEAEAGDSKVAAEWDAAGNLLAETQDGRRVEYKLDPLGDVLALELVNGPGSLEFARDGRGRLTGIRVGGQAQQTFQHDEADLLVARTAGLATERFAYDAEARVVAREIRVGDRQTLAQTFRYDTAGNLSEFTDVARGGQRKLIYDAAGRVIRTTLPGGETREFGYDPADNLKLRDDVEFSHAPGGELREAGRSKYYYDANGFPIRRVDAGGRETLFTWDELDQLIEVRSGASTARYKYDALGRRISKTVDGRQTRFVWAGDHLLAEVTDGQTTLHVTPDLVPLMQMDSGGIHHLATELNGVPLAALNPAGDLEWLADNDEFGANAASAFSPFRLTGQYADAETGLHYNRFRYFNPGAGRFLSPDPIGFEGGLNLFVFAPNTYAFEDALGLTCGNTGCGIYSNYVLENASGEIVYSGITMQTEQDRCNQHRAAGKKFHRMRVYASGLTRDKSRGLEGSSLHYLSKPSFKKKHKKFKKGSSLQNAVRKDGGYYHSYAPGHKRFKTSAAVEKALLKKIKTLK